MAFLQMLRTEFKVELKKGKKVQTALSKLSIPDFDPALYEGQGLKTFFYGVFKVQKNESEKSRQNLLRNTLIARANEKALKVFGDEIEQLESKVKPGKEIRDLAKLIKKIKTATQKRYDYLEVATMLQFIDQTAELEIARLLLDESIAQGTELRKRLAAVSRALKSEQNWGSWELFFSKKVDVENIPPSGVDEAFEEILEVDVLVRKFHFYVKDYFNNRDMTLHTENLVSFVDEFVHSMLIDWMFESKIKATFSRVSQMLNSIDMLLYGLNTLSVRNRNELALSQTERDARIARIGEFIKAQESKK
jgi:hypothetical protein